MFALEQTQTYPLFPLAEKVEIWHRKQFSIIHCEQASAWHSVEWSLSQEHTAAPRATSYAQKQLQ